MDYDINFKELFAIVAAAFTFGKEWYGKQIIFYSDNLNVSTIWSSGTSKNPLLMRLVRALFLHSARNDFNILIKFIPGKDNVLADLLSRSQVHRFKQLHRDADKFPTQLPTRVWEV